MTRNLAPLQAGRPGLAAREIRLQFKLLGAAVRRKVADSGPLRALVFHPSDGRQVQRWARPMGSGMFEVILPAPGTGSCCLFLDCTMPGGGYADVPCIIFRPGQGKAAATCTPGRTECSG